MGIELKKIYKYLVEEVDDKEIKKLAMLLLDYTNNGSMQDFDEEIEQEEINNLEDLDKDKLINFIKEYNNYILDFNEDFQGLDRIPVCINEFFENEYKELGDK